MTVLVVGSGGREHALAWKIARSPRVRQVIVAPGNPGMSLDVSEVTLTFWDDVRLAEGMPGFERLAKRAREARVDLAVIGPDDPLALGIVGAFEREGVLCFGPSAAAAQVEASKGFAKDLMRAAGVPTAGYHRFSKLDEALSFLQSVPVAEPSSPFPWVIKADGLALGKGVSVCATRAEALAATRELFPISGSLVIEEFLAGEELSWFALCDGERCALLEPAQDHKRAYDGDRGPNTGGMGTYSPVPGVPAHWAQRLEREIVLPVLRELARRGTPFKGLLFVGLMGDVKNDRLSVVEFNARFGDPETQAVLWRMEDDLVDWLEAAARGALASLGRTSPQFKSTAAVCVIGAAPGYPDHPEKGAPIAAKVPHVFYAGVRRRVDGGLEASGGRVLGAMGEGRDLADARASAYRQLERVRFERMHFRTDIGASGGLHG